ncbi:MAG: hypothetical protein KGL32_07065 [candidate division NC10 bacterium]|nr:hypothetical protein [candidate division NC10 bacterium]
MRDLPTEWGKDYAPAILSLMHWLQRPYFAHAQFTALIEASWTGILLARQLATIDRNR